VNERVRATVIAAAGGQGRQLTQILGEAPDTDVVAVVENHNRKLAQVLAERYGAPGCRVYRTTAQAIGAVPFDIGFVCSRPGYHASQTIALLQAGKKVHCEKPPTPNLASMRRVHQAAAENGGWVRLNFHLDVQTEPLTEVIADGEIDAPLVIITKWMRGQISGKETQAALVAGLRRGQTGSPMDDLCHTIRAALKSVPEGAIVTRVRGHSWGNLEILYATVRFPWRDTLREATIITMNAWDVPLPGVGSQDVATAEIYAAGGFAGLTFLLDNTVAANGIVPSEFYPTLVALDGRQRIRKGLIASPQPSTPFECMRIKVHETIRLFQSGDTPADRTDGGLEVMRVIDGFRRSVRTGREVAVSR
jgi:predicted dehydrogenase